MSDITQEDLKQMRASSSIEVQKLLDVIAEKDKEIERLKDQVSSLSMTAYDGPYSIGTDEHGNIT